MARMLNPPHPGQILADTVLREVGSITVTEFAERLGMTRAGISRVIHGNAGISAELSIRLEAALGTSAESWLAMQAAYDLSQARRKHSQAEPAEALDAAGWTAHSLDNPSVAAAWKVCQQRSRTAAAGRKPPRYVVLLGRNGAPPHLFDMQTKSRVRSAIRRWVKPNRRPSCQSVGARAMIVYHVTGPALAGLECIKGGEGLSEMAGAGGRVEECPVQSDDRRTYLCEAATTQAALLVTGLPGRATATGSRIDPTLGGSAEQSPGGLRHAPGSRSPKSSPWFGVLPNQ